MTDKQIIIDYKNLCENYSQEVGCYGTFNGSCIKEQCFTYKLLQQLQAKEQECERLKKIINEAKNSKLDLNSFFAIEAIVGEYQLELDQLKADNRILKEKFEIAIKNNMDKTLLRLENGDVKEELQEIREEFGIETLYCHDDNTRVHRCIKLLQLKDCLTEIKEIAEKCCIMQATLDCENYDDCTQCGRISDGEGIQQILQKISEVENGN